MNTRLQKIDLESFTGGLNLRRSDFQLADTESPAMLNVEVDPRGGVATRRGWRRWLGTDVAVVPASWDPRHASVHSKSDGTFEVYVANGATVWAGNDSGFPDTGIPCSATPHLADFAPWGDKMYIAAGINETNSYVRDGVVATPLIAPTGEADNNWNDDYTIPVGGVMPRAEYVTTHSGYSFVAYTNEDQTFPNRLRWSHPNDPEDWAYLDKIDINIGGGRITGLMSFRDHLLIFKTDSMWALYGYNTDSWQLIKVSLSIGAPSPAAITRSETAVFFYGSADRSGIYAYAGGEPINIDEKLRTMLERITRFDDVFVGWVGHRLWVSIPDISTNRPSQAYIFDPEIGEGAWVRHQAAIGSITCIVDRSDVETNYPLAVLKGDSGISNFVLLDNIEDAVDEIEDGVLSPFVAEYRTGWKYAGMQEVRKSWRRARFIVNRGAADVDIVVDSFRDYDSVALQRSGTISIIQTGTAFWSESEGNPNPLGFNWDDGTKWQAKVDGTAIVRSPSFGIARALQLRFRTGPATPGRAWGIDSVTLKYLTRRFTT